MSNSEDRKTSIDGASGDARRETRVASNEYSDSHQSTISPSHKDDRRIVGIIITYNWDPAGKLFPIRLGKNYIGRERVGRMPGDPDCDIQVDDPKMSSSHTLILCRELRDGGEVKFDLIDQESSNGTYLNDELVSLTGETLTDDRAKISTGSTVWTLIKIDHQSKEVSEGANT